MLKDSLKGTQARHRLRALHAHRADIGITSGAMVMMMPMALIILLVCAALVVIVLVFRQMSRKF